MKIGLEQLKYHQDILGINDDIINSNNSVDKKISKLSKKYDCDITIKYSKNNFFPTIIIEHDDFLIYKCIGFDFNLIESKCKEFYNRTFENNKQMMIELNKLAQNKDLFPDDLFKK